MWTAEVRIFVLLYLKLFALLYADDTIIMAESSHELQAALNGLNHYCNIWKLKVNVSKTKVVIFANRQPKHLPQFRLGNLVIDVTTGYTYLGMYIKCNGNMLEGIMQLKKQASRAMFSLLQKSRKLGLNVDIQMQLFDSLVLPICLYGCEVWGFKHVEIAESLHLQFCKTVLKLNKSTPSCMVLGELGRFKLQYNVDIRMLTYWYKTVCGISTKLAHIFYTLLFKMSNHGIYCSQWILRIKNILQKYDLYNFWQEQNNLSITEINHFKIICKQKIACYYKNEWKECLENSSKCYLYRGFKTELKMEEYLYKLPDDLRICLSKYRMCNHKLPIEVGRHNNIDRKYRLCTKCDKKDLGDEYHYMFMCDCYEASRRKLIPKRSYKHPSVFKFCELMTTKSGNTLMKIAKFARIIMKDV